MESVRVQPIDRNQVSVQIACGCGRLANLDQDGREAGFSFRIRIGVRYNKVIRCKCGEHYLLRSQASHVHVSGISAETFAELLKGGTLNA